MALIIRLSIILLSLLSLDLYGQPRLRAGATLVHEDGNLLIYNNADEKGFVITSSEEGMPEVLGYSDTGYFDPNNIPPAMKFWMEMMNANCKAVSNGAEFPIPTVTRAERPEVKPLLGDMSWGQDAPYNYKCPMDGESRSASGCAATAMSMLFNYHRNVKGAGSIEYTTNTKKFRVIYDFAEGLKNIDWNNLLDVYTAEAEIISGELVSEEFGTDLIYTNMMPEGVMKGIAIKVDTLINISQNETSGEVQLLLFDSNGDFISPIGSTISFANAKKRSGYAHTLLYVTLPESLADGTYTALLGYKKVNAERWKKPNRVKYSKISSGKIKDPITLTIEKNGGKVKVGDYTCNVAFTEAQADAVSELMYACGAAVEMDYTYSEESAASIANISTAFNKYFGYDKDIYACICEYMFNENNQQLIIDDLAEDRPVFVAGLTSNGAGHAFIADGVRYSNTGTPTFHINWGWDGGANGYFLLTNLNPYGNGDDYNYSNELYLIMGIMPDDGVDQAPPIAYESLTCDNTNLSVGEKVTITLKNVANVLAYDLKHTPVAFAVDMNGKETELGSFDTIKGVKPLNYSTKPSVVSVEIPSTLESGTYKIIARFKSTDGLSYGKCLSDYNPTIQVTNATGISSVSQDEETPDGNTFDLLGRKKTDNEGVMIENGKVKIRK